jgi:hypothetical protein
MSEKATGPHLINVLEDLLAKEVQAAPLLLEDAQKLGDAAGEYLLQLHASRSGNYMDHDEITKVFGSFSEGEREPKAEADARKQFQRAVSKFLKDLKEAVTRKRITEEDALGVVAAYRSALGMLDEKGLVLSEQVPHSDKGDTWMQQAIDLHDARTFEGRPVKPEEARAYFVSRGTLWPNARGIYPNIDGFIAELVSKGRGL